MFTGIIEEVGTVARIQRGRFSAVLTVKARVVLEGLKAGDSIAVNGVCLTVTTFDSRSFTVDIMHESLDRSALVQLAAGSSVNLERAMAANGRFGGHIVSGHVDGVGTIVDIRRDDVAVWYTIQANPPIMKLIVEKGSVAIDGISLTVARVDSDRFSISAIPHTAAVTTLGQRQVGELVNLENDVIGKYVEKLLRPEPQAKAQSSITRDFLARYGY